MVGWMAGQADMCNFDTLKLIQSLCFTVTMPGNQKSLKCKAKAKVELYFPLLQFWSDYYFRAPQDAIVKTLVRNRVDTYMYVQNTTVEALKLPYWRQIPHNLEHFFLSGAPFMDPEFFSEDQQVCRIDRLLGLEITIIPR